MSVLLTYFFFFFVIISTTSSQELFASWTILANEDEGVDRCLGLAFISDQIIFRCE